MINVPLILSFSNFTLKKLETNSIFERKLRFPFEMPFFKLKYFEHDHFPQFCYIQENLLLKTSEIN